MPLCLSSCWWKLCWCYIREFPGTPPEYFDIPRIQDPVKLLESKRAGLQQKAVVKAAQKLSSETERTILKAQGTLVHIADEATQQVKALGDLLSQTTQQTTAEPGEESCTDAVDLHKVTVELNPSGSARQVSFDVQRQEIIYLPPLKVPGEPKEASLEVVAPQDSGTAAPIAVSSLAASASDDSPERIALPSSLPSLTSSEQSQGSRAGVQKPDQQQTTDEEPAFDGYPLTPSGSSSVDVGLKTKNSSEINKPKR